MKEEELQECPTPNVSLHSDPINALLKREKQLAEHVEPMLFRLDTRAWGPGFRFVQTADVAVSTNICGSRAILWRVICHQLGISPEKPEGVRQRTARWNGGCCCSPSCVSTIVGISPDSLPLSIQPGKPPADKEKVMGADGWCVAMQTCCEPVIMTGERFVNLLQKSRFHIRIQGVMIMTEPPMIDW